MLSAIQSMILGHVKRGIDPSTEEYKEGIVYALSDIARYECEFE